MPILFAGNEFDACISGGADAKFSTTTAYARDTKYSPRGELQSYKGTNIYCPFSSSIGIGETVWCHFRAMIRMSASITFGENIYSGPFFHPYKNGNSGALPVGAYLKKTKVEGLFPLRPFIGIDANRTVQEVGSIGYVADDSQHTFDMCCTLDPIFGKILIYMDGVLVAAYYGDTTLGGLITIWDGFVLRNTDPNGEVDAAGVTFSFSECLASTSKTIGQRVVSLYPTADGDTAEWTGTFDNVNDTTVDDGTSLSTATVDATHLLAMSDVSASLPADLAIAAIITSTRASNNETGVAATLAHLVKTGGTIYEGAPISLEASLPVVQTIWEMNPATKEEWTIPEVNALQMGIRAKS